MNRRTAELTIYAKSRKAAMTYALALMPFAAAQMDVYRTGIGEWTAYYIEVA